MKAKLNILIIFSFFLNLSSFKAVSEQKAVSYCKASFQKIIEDPSVSSMVKALNLWGKYEKSCSINGEYDLYKSYIFLKYESISECKKFLENILLESEYNTREHEYVLGGIYLLNKNIDKLYDLSVKMIKKYPDWSASSYLYGAANLEIGRLKEAELYLKKSIEQNSNFCGPHGMISYLYYKKKLYDKCLYHWNKAFQINPMGVFFFKSSTNAAIKLLLEKGDDMSLGYVNYILDVMSMNIVNIESDEQYNKYLEAYYDAVSKLKY